MRTMWEREINRCWMAGMKIAASSKADRTAAQALRRVLADRPSCSMCKSTRVMSEGLTWPSAKCPINGSTCRAVSPAWGVRNVRPSRTDTAGMRDADEHHA